MSRRTVLNFAPQHAFNRLSEVPEAQVLLLVPRAIWERARAYVPQFESVELAGRLGADPGDYEWEVIDQPNGFKWWRRTASGDPVYCAAVVAPDPDGDPIEVFGLIDIASDSPWWFDAVEDIDHTQGQAELIARQRGLSIDDARLMVSKDEYRPRELLVSDAKEVANLKDALIGLFGRAREAKLPQ